MKWNGRPRQRGQEQPLPFDLQIRPERAYPTRHGRAPLQPYLGNLSRYMDRFREYPLAVLSGEGLSDTGTWAVVLTPAMCVLGHTDDMGKGLAYARAADFMFPPGGSRVRLYNSSEVSKL